MAAYESWAASWSGQRSARNGMSSARVRGRSTSNRVANAFSSSTSSPSSARPNGLWPYRVRCITGSRIGRSATASLAVTRWSVARSNPIRTAPRWAIGPASASGRKRSSRDHSAT